MHRQRGQQMDHNLEEAPKIIAPDPAGIPQELKDINRWVLWKSKQDEKGRWTKVPYQAGGGKAKTNDLKTWSTFDEAWEKYETGDYSGVGIVLNGDGLVGVDLDKCRPDGALAQEAIDTIKRLDAYTEVSPSGNGIRIFVRGDLPVDGKRKGPVEVYKKGRFLTVTGKAHPDCPKTIPNRTAELDSFYKDAFGDNDKPTANQKFERLKTGNWEGLYPSQSEADLALASHLAYQLGYDKEAIDAAFRRTGLMRPKWDELRGGKTYGQMTIDAACDEKKPSKRPLSRANRLIALASSEYELFHDQEGEAFATVEVSGHQETYRTSSKSFSGQLNRDFFAKEGLGASNQDIKDALLTIDGKAVNEGPQLETFVRLAGAEEAIYLDLANEGRDVVEITPTGWSVKPNGEVRFLRPPGMSALSTPVRGGSVEDLRGFINLEDPADWPLVVAFILACFNPSGPYPGLEVIGEQGSAKSTAMKVIKRLTDPHTVEVRSLPRNLQDLAILSTNSWVPSFDNVSTISDHMSDALCGLSTGGGFATRTLYADREETLFFVKRPFMLNGINAAVKREDLADRVMQLRLAQISEGDRRAEREFWRTFSAKAPAILGAILNAVSGALRGYKDVDMPFAPRMADFAMWVTAAEPALGWETGTFLREYTRNRKETASQAVDADQVLSAVADFMRRRREWQGTTSELLSTLSSLVGDDVCRNKWWPKIPSYLSRSLNRGAAVLRQEGVDVSFKKLSGKRVVVLENTLVNALGGLDCGNGLVVT